jgi:Pyruvate/2-oxoacid:ferredoxin oxidoreductase delta subunit
VFQIRIHGRGGQGVVTAAEMLSVAAFLEGKYAQAFPSFGSERTGAPVVAFCRIDDEEIRLREPIIAPDASFDKLNPWYYADAPKTVRPLLDIARRRSTFDEVVKGLDETNALFEARRCLSCGNCFECDNCYGVCPDNAVIKLGPGKRFQFNLDYCKGCGMCVAECPCGAIRMDPETI